MAHRNVYTVVYKMESWGHEKEISVIATSKEDALKTAVEWDIFDKELYYPCEAHVKSVTYQNGHYHRFN